VLRRSLDAVDRSRNRLLIGLAAMMILLLVMFLRGVASMHSGGGTGPAILAHYFMLIIWVTALALIVIIQINAMTKKILRAIELAGRK
jgi:hypothetical protein